MPLLITATCYIWIAIKTNVVHRSTHANARSVTTHKLMRVTVMVFALVVAHVLLTLPALTINLIATFSAAFIERHLDQRAGEVVILMFFANCAVNPLLYGLFNTNFQAAFQRCPCRRRKVVAAPPPASPGLAQGLRATNSVVVANKLSVNRNQ